MSILDAAKKINIWALVAICLVLGLGLVAGSAKLVRLKENRQPISIDRSKISQLADVNSGLQPNQPNQSGVVVGSKSGKKYHLLDCPGAKTIADKNKVFFESIAAAEAAGYNPAANCKGLSKKP